MRKTGTLMLRDISGSAAIEFGLLAPVFIAMLVGVLQVGDWMQSYNAMRNSIADTARNVSVEYQTDNRLTDVQIAQYGLATATTAPYLLNTDNVTIDVDQPAVQRIAGARELELTITYEMSSFLEVVGISGPTVSYSRPLFLTN